MPVLPMLLMAAKALLSKKGEAKGGGDSHPTKKPEELPEEEEENAEFEKLIQRRKSIMGR